VRTLLEERHEFVRQLLSEHREQLDALVQALLHHETVEQDDLAQILGQRSADIS
jgi:ATP-dependent Zn protease